MEVGILHPQDCLKRNHHHQRTSLISPANKPRRHVNPNSNTNLKRRNSQSPPPPNGSTNKAQQSRPKSPPVAGPVRILKHGEEISLPPPNPEPKPEPRPALPGSMVDEFYAGSTFATSPAPSEVPLPAFFTRGNCGFVNGDAHTHEIACEPRRVLKLH
ncbi:Centromere-associated protein E [Bienertia sinuspersici]